MTSVDRPRVVILGGGFGGLSAARALARVTVDVTLIDRHNYHLFQPLLYQVATAALAPNTIAAPIRAVLRAQHNATVLMETVTGIDAAGRAVLIGEQRLAYDFLIIATGAHHAYFGHDEWEKFAPGIKTLSDALSIRQLVLSAFEAAEISDDPSERRRLLNFVLVGAGPTGVELAGAIAELAKASLVHDFRNIDPSEARIILIEAGPRILPTFPKTSSAAAQRMLERLGVEVRVGSAVTVCDADGVEVSGERIGARSILWAAGVAASPAAQWLDDAADRAGRVVVLDDLSVPGHPEIFAVGDTCSSKSWNGEHAPGIAPAAKQMGAYAASVIRARVERASPPPPFRYSHRGSLATIGRNNAVADFGWMTLSGWPAWLTWSVAHIYFLIGFRSRVVVALDWLWAYVTFRRGARIILAETAGATADRQPMPPTSEYANRPVTGPRAQSGGRGGEAV
jgi:NADH:ubiquinone reductase (H+-translocating)